MVYDEDVQDNINVLVRLGDSNVLSAHDSVILQGTISILRGIQEQCPKKGYN